MSKITVLLGQKDHRKFELGQVKSIIAQPQTERLQITPTTSEQVFTSPKDKYFDQVTVEAVTNDIDSNITENNIRQGVEILGVIGNLAPDKPDQSKTTIPTKERQVVRADLGYELAENIVEPIPDEYADISNVDATAEDVLNGKVFVDNQGNEVQGTAELKEDLDAELTAQDEQIERLTIAIDGLEEGGSGEIVIDLPSEFATATSIYTFKFDDDKILLSANKSDNVGVWQYSIKNKTIVQLYTARYNWRYFQVVGDKCLIGGDSNAYGLLVYDGNTIEQIYTSGSSWSTFKPFGYKCLVTGSGNSGVFLYDSLDNTFTSIYSSGTYWSQFEVIGNKWFIYGTSSSTTGLLLFDLSEETLIKIYDVGYNWGNFKTFNDEIIFSSTSLEGVFLYDGNAVEQIYNQGKNWDCFQQFGNKALFSSTSTAGILVYDGNTTTKIYDKNNAWRYSVIVGDKCLISCGTGGTGLLVYDGNTVEQIYDQGYSWNCFQIIGNKCLLSGMFSGNSGILLYDGNTATKIYNSGYLWSHSKLIGDKCLIGGISNGANSIYSSGVLLYYNDTITLKTSIGADWEYFTENSDGTIDINSSHETYKKYTLTYNPVDDSVKLTKVKVV